MCYFNSIRIRREEYVRLQSSHTKIAFLSEDLAIHKGFDYGHYPVIRAKGGKHETERVDMEWGFLPPYINTEDKIKNFRFGYKDAGGQWHKGYTTLNATSEQLLDKLFRDSALHRRCLIPSAGFFEWMHVQVVGRSGKLLKTPERFPYHIRLKNQEEFFMAGIWQPHINTDTGDATGTFAIVTTVANTLMKQIHNSRERMPTILPGYLADAWLYNNLTDQQILDIANFQVASEEMLATPLHKDFLSRSNPLKQVIYEEARLVEE